MPGLSQLKEFSKNLLALGDEANLRASRGEKPVLVTIPSTIEDVDDSEDFVLGMPENEAEPEPEEIDDDLSELTGLSSAPAKTDSSDDSENTSAFSAPDMSDLLAPMGTGEEGAASDMPDLSMFMDEEEPVPEAEPEPEEISIADMGLEALLAGGGFDEPEEPEETEPEETENQGIEPLETEELGNIEDFLSPLEPEESGSDDLSAPSAENPDDTGSSALEEAGSLDDLGTGGLEDIGGLEGFDALDDSGTADLESVDNLDDPEHTGLEAIDDLDDFGSLEETAAAEPQEVPVPQEAPEAESFAGEAQAQPAKPSVTLDENSSIDDILDNIEDVEIDIPAQEPASSPKEELDTFGIDDYGYEDFDYNAHAPVSADEELFSQKEESSKAQADDVSEPENTDEPAKPEHDYSKDTLDLSGLDAGGIEGLEDLGDLDAFGNAGNVQANEDENATPSDFGSIDLDSQDSATDESAQDSAFDFDTSGLDDMDAFSGESPLGEDVSPRDALDGMDSLGDTSGLDLDNLGDGMDNTDSLGAGDADLSGLDGADDFGTGNDLGDIDLGDADLGGLDLGDLGSLDIDSPDAAAPLGDETDLGDTLGGDILGDTGGFGGGNEPGDALGSGDSFDLGSLDLGDLGSLDIDSPDSAAPLGEADALGSESPLGDETDLGNALDGMDSLSGTSDFDSPDLLGGDLGDLELGGEEAPGSGDGLGDFDLGDFDNASTPGEDTDLADTSDLDLGGLDLGDIDIDSAPVINETDEIQDFDDFSPDSSSDSEGVDEPIEVFDTSDIENLDFGIPDTDSQLNGGDFELGDSDDFAMEGEFEIPGFSDVETAKEEKKSKPLATGKSRRGKNKDDLPEPDFSDAEEGDSLPPNTLSDAQYKVFLKNLNEYPLNVRLAFEDLIVQDEFTDDAEFEIIEKILNKAPARQVASMLEKMLDISIPVPRDFEHRSAEEYEAYKKSLSYQLRNKIIPAALVGIVSLLVLWGLFNFGKNCIYKPLKANSLYKQGYALLEADEYPQSEMKFNEAVSYRISKKWFFNYARGYRAHKQYQRAGNMYQNILKCFRHDKPAGLEYADMELNDMANYPRAEEIVRREVLDYHINDQDGILMLGDIFLEWATEKDPSKFESSREQYATLLQLYGANDLYKSRMMRYFIRTDNLREVLQLKPDFENRDKSLSAEDWAELSGYLLDKYYGPMDPSEEYLRYEIEGLRGLLIKAVKADTDNPIAYYNLAKYFINTNESDAIESTLQRAIEKFNMVPSMKTRDVYKYIDSYRLLGEHYMANTDYLQAQEQFAEGISLYTTERDNAGFAGTPQVGKLYEDMGNIKYSISGDYDDALMNYKYSVELENDSPSIRYRIGYIQYKNKNYLEALGAFMKAGDGNIKERNLQLAMANTLFLRGDDYAAEGYYNQLIDTLDREIAERGIVFPQASVNDYDTVNTYLYAANNYGVTLYRLAKRTGNSGMNAQAIVQFSQSVRAWDALTRNQDTLVRLPGSNLAEQNIKYITNPIPEFEPSIYIDIPKTLVDNEDL